MAKTGVAFVYLNFLVGNKMSVFLPFDLMFLAAVTLQSYRGILQRKPEKQVNMFPQQDSLMCVLPCLKWELTAAEGCCGAFSQALVEGAVSPGVHALSSRRGAEL